MNDEDNRKWNTSRLYLLCVYKITVHARTHTDVHTRAHTHTTVILGLSIECSSTNKYDHET